MQSYKDNKKYDKYTLNVICIPDSFNTNISQQLFDYTIIFVNSQRLNSTSKGDFVLKNQFCFKDFWYAKTHRNV